MANTELLKLEVEKFACAALREKYGVEFTKQRLQLITGGMHEFDAVSADRTIVTSIKSHSGLTSGGNIPAGKIHTAIAEVYFLSLVQAPKRQLILTTPEFFEILSRSLRGKIAPGVDIVLLPLSNELQTLVTEVQRKASLEMRPSKD